MVFNKRRTKCFGLLLALFIMAGLSLSVFSDASAFNFGTAYTYPIYGATLYGNKGGNSITAQSYVLSNGEVYELVVSDGQGVDTPTFISRINFDIGNSRILAGSLINFTLRFRASGAFVVPQAEYLGSNAIILNRNCITIRDSYNYNSNSYVLGDYECSYWVYTSNNIDGTLMFFLSSRFDWASGFNQVVQVPQQINAVVITSDSGGGGGSNGLTADDRTFLSQQINSIISSNNSATTAINQLKTLIDSQGDSQQETLDNIESAITEQNEAENEAYDNISNQSPSDIDDASSSQTTSILNTISSFLTALQGFQATSCQLTLPFPNYAGGSTTVDPCSGKEKAPTLVQVGSSLLLIGTFVPLAFIVLRMIYNEIRSWTSG